MGRNTEGKTFSLVHSGMPASGSSSLPDKEAVHISHHLPAPLFIWKQSRKKKKKSPHQKLFWHCWSSLAQVLRGCRRWAESWGSPALCGELQGDQAVWRKGGMWGLGNAEFLFCRRSSCCYSGFCVFNHQMQLLSFDRIRRKAVYNGALTAWHTPNLWFKAFFVLNLFL